MFCCLSFSAPALKPYLHSGAKICLNLIEIIKWHLSWELSISIDKSLFLSWYNLTIIALNKHHFQCAVETIRGQMGTKWFSCILLSDIQWNKTPWSLSWREWTTRGWMPTMWWKRFFRVKTSLRAYWTQVLKVKHTLKLCLHSHLGMLCLFPELHNLCSKGLGIWDTQL